MKIGSLRLNNPLALAPMENITDQAFRLICRTLGADLVYTEFASCEAIIRNVPKALRKIQVLDRERPVGIQIFGSNITSLEKAVQIVEHFKPNIIDLNCGCSTKRHALRGECSGLLKSAKQLENIIKTLVKTTKIPITVKTRLGWDKPNINICEVAQIIEQAGAQALTIHCRTRCQAYKGSADWTWLEKVKKLIKIPLIGNGDILTSQHAKHLFDLGCDGIMIGRGAIANPWIFEQIKFELDKGKSYPGPTPEKRIRLCLDHLKDTIAERGNYYGILHFRKFFSTYLRGLPHAAQLRRELIVLTDYELIESMLLNFLSEIKKEKKSSKPQPSFDDNHLPLKFRSKIPY